MINEASTLKTTVTSRAQNVQCQRGSLALLTNRFGTRVVRVVGRAADVYYDWKVEVLGSPIWCIDARSDAPAFTNMALAMDGQLMPLAETGDVESAIA